MIVKTIDMSIASDCECNSWLDHWEKYSANRAMFCNDAFCVNLAAVGAHVIKVDSDDVRYIVPLCLQHTLPSGQQVELREDSILVAFTEQIHCCA